MLQHAPAAGSCAASQLLPRAHDGHYRKGSGLPYISHPMSVMLIAASVTNDEDVLLAALFHDILEDVPENYSRAEMEDEFGPRVVEIVEGVTKDSSLPSWQERADAYLEQLSHGSEESLIVAAADKFHNLSQTLEDLDRDGHALWDRFRSTPSQQLWWYTSVRNVIAERLPDMPLLADLSVLIERLDSWVQEA
ncbi:HD domain-containing protein [Corynebacterium amycolatum]|uniref:HD domain-containing protein n=1 Tax=Corynebacterium amycolatum TaxID=43765 RepID=UPI00396B261F